MFLSGYNSTPFPKHFAPDQIFIALDCYKNIGFYVFTKCIKSVYPSLAMCSSGGTIDTTFHLL